MHSAMIYTSHIVWKTRSVIYRSYSGRFQSYKDWNWSIPVEIKRVIRSVSTVLPINKRCLHMRNIPSGGESLLSFDWSFILRVSAWSEIGNTIDCIGITGMWQQISGLGSRVWSRIGSWNFIQDLTQDLLKSRTWPKTKWNIFFWLGLALGLGF